MERSLCIVVAHCCISPEIMKEAISQLPEQIVNVTQINVKYLHPKELPITQEEIVRRNYAVKKVKESVEASLDDGVDVVFVSKTVRQWLDPERYQRNPKLSQIPDSFDPLEITAQIAYFLGQKYRNVN